MTASDGFLGSASETRTFTVDPDAVDEPVGEGDPGAGCACDAAPGAGTGGLFAAFIGILLAGGRRARSFGTTLHGRRE